MVSSTMKGPLRPEELSIRPRRPLNRQQIIGFWAAWSGWMLDGTALLSIGTIFGCIVLPMLAEQFGRKVTLGIYFLGMLVCIAGAFGWAFYLPVGTALGVFITWLFFLGFFGGNFAVFSLWLPELFGTEVRDWSSPSPVRREARCYPIRSVSV